YGATLVRAVDWALSPITRIEVSGPRGQGAACNMHLLALQTYRPRKLVVRKTAERPAATVCVGTTCSLPVTTPEALGDLLRSAVECSAAPASRSAPTPSARGPSAATGSPTPTVLPTMPSRCAPCAAPTTAPATSSTRP